MDDDEILLGIGKRIRHFRERRGLTQEDLAHGCGLNRSYISDIECGRRNVAILNLNAIAGQLNVKLYRLMPDFPLK